MEESVSSLLSLNKKSNNHENITPNQQLNNAAGVNLSYFNSKSRFLGDEIKRI